MRSTFRKLRGGALFIAMTARLGVAPVAAELQGDEAAIALADEMMAAMGGREVWAEAVWMHAKERSASLNQKNLLAYEGWRGLQIEAGRYRIENEDITYEQAWTPEGGARILNGEYLQFDEERLAGEVDFWPREIYTLYHRFAAGDETLRLISEGERAFRVENAETGASMGSFTISLEGGPVLWSSGDTEDDVTYVYGPLEAFGDIKLPAWGAQTNGAWRFNYLDATLHADPPPADLFAPPTQ